MKEQLLLYKLVTSRKKVMVSMLALMIISNFVLVYATTGTEDATQDTLGKNIGCIFCKIANLLFLITAALAAIVVILAGIRWVTAADDPGARNGAKTTIISAFVGLIIILVAVFIVQYVVQGILPTGAINPTGWITGVCECNFQNTGEPTETG